MQIKPPILCFSEWQQVAMPAKARRRSRELADLHGAFDVLGIPEGLAAERFQAWLRRRVIQMRNAGHLVSCQCVACNEFQIMRRYMECLAVRREGMGEDDE